MSNYYKGQQGALRFIADITDDCDGYKTIQGLKELIKEVRKEAIRALTEKEKYDINNINVDTK